MTQRRMIYASLWQSENFAKLSDKGKILYIGLLTLADDYGRLKNNPLVLRSQVFCYEENIKTSEIGKLVKEIEKVGLVILYENDQYLYHPNWYKYQILRKDRLGRSLCPSPDNQMSTKWQPTDGQVGAEVSKEVIEVSNKDNLKRLKEHLVKSKIIKL